MTKALWLCPAFAGAMLATPAAREPSLSTVLTRAGEYVARFQRELSTVVAEEDYVQERRGPEMTERRELRSDLLLVRPGGTTRYVQFRDVFSVDGGTVRTRDERLLKLAADPSSFSAAQIVAESARYNIGDITRTINVPVLPLTFLLADNRWRFKFSRQRGLRQPTAQQDLPASPHFAVSTEVWVVEYREVERRTIIRSAEDGRDVPARGRFWIDPGSGRVLMCEMLADEGAVHSRIDVSFQSEPLLGLLVPIEMHETYWRMGDPIRIEGMATYSNFRLMQGSR